MSAAEGREVPVTREGAVGALKLLMLVLAAVIFWQAAGGVGAEFAARGLVTAPPFVQGGAQLLLGIGIDAPFNERLATFWAANHRAAAMAAMLAAIVLLLTRFLLMGRVLDYLYLESEARERRVYFGFLGHILLMLAQAGALCAVVHFSRAGLPQFAAPALAALLTFNLVWAAGVLLGARQGERRALRGVWFLALTALAAGAALLWGAWTIESLPGSYDGMLGSALLVYSAGAASVLCLTDGLIQSRLYRPARRASGA